MNPNFQQHILKMSLENILQHHPNSGKKDMWLAQAQYWCGV
jgi:hypothetical protein